MSIAVGILSLILSCFFAGDKAEYRRAHEICPDGFVEWLDEGVDIECDEQRHHVVCTRDGCDVTSIPL